MIHLHELSKQSSFLKIHNLSVNFHCLLSAKLYDRRCGRSSARLRATTAGHGDGRFSTGHQEAVSKLLFSLLAITPKKIICLFLILFRCLVRCRVPCRIFSVLSAILYLGNVTYSQKSTGREEGLDVGPPEVLSTLSDLLKVRLSLLPVHQIIQHLQSSLLTVLLLSG